MNLSCNLKPLLSQDNLVSRVHMWKTFRAVLNFFYFLLSVTPRSGKRYRTGSITLGNINEESETGSEVSIN